MFDKFLSLLPVISAQCAMELKALVCYLSLVISMQIWRYGRQICKPVSVLSMVTKQMIDYVYNIHGHKVLEWNHQVLSPANLQTHVDALTAKGAPLSNCFGFIDGSVRPLSRPGEHQRILYNGYKRVHALKFQSVALPNALIENLYGPVGKL